MIALSSSCIVAVLMASVLMPSGLRLTLVKVTWALRVSVPQARTLFLILLYLNLDVREILGVAEQLEAEHEGGPREALLPAPQHHWRRRRSSLAPTSFLDPSLC